MTLGTSQTSLRFRFAFSMVAWVIIGLMLVGVSASALFRRHVETVFHAELEEHLVELVGLTAIGSDDLPHLTRPLSDPRYAKSGSGYYWQVNGQNGIILRSPSLGPQQLTISPGRERQLVHRQANGPSGPIMLYSVAQNSDRASSTLYFLVATDMRHIDEVEAAFRRDLVAWLATLAALLLAGAFLALRFVMHPLDRLSAAIARVRAGEDSQMGTDWPAEIVPLASDLDRLIESREAMVSAARIEAGNLAHGLRTSLAILADEAENLAGHPAGATLRAHCMAMARRLEWHLARARAAAGAGAVTETRLPDALDPLLIAMRRLHGARSIDFSATGPALRIAIDPDAFSEILSNLLDNAGKWATGRVAVTWRPAQGNALIVVTDDGPGITDETARTLCRPGVRLDETMPGHGLGLAIALDLATVANGELALAPRSDGERGTQAIFTVPLA